MSKEKHLDDLAQIRSIMERSQKYLSLSPWAAIMAGLYALGGSTAVWIRYPGFFQQWTSESLRASTSTGGLVAIAAAILILSGLTAISLNARQAQRSGGALWTAAARRLALNFIFPMLVGGVFILALSLKGYFDLVPAAMLVFYGLALINAGNFTFSNVRILGVGQVITGMAAALWPGSGLWWWVFGFGWLHLIYGAWLLQRLNPQQKTTA